MTEKNKANSNEYNTRVVECRLAAKLIAKKCLVMGGWMDVVRLRDVQVKMGKELADMEQVVRDNLHQEDYTREELVDLLDVEKDFLVNNILTENTRELTNFRLYHRAMHVFADSERVNRRGDK